MQSLSAQQIANTPLADLVDLEPGMYQVTFADGVKELSRRRIILNSFWWQYAKYFPEVEITTYHCFSDTHITKGTTVEYLGRMYYTVTDTIPDVDLDQLDILAYQFTNEIANFNVGSKETLKHVGTISALDFVDIIFDPEIEKINESALPNPDSIEKTHNKVLERIRTNDAFKDNALRRALNSRFVTPGQMLHCVSVRGFLTETDSTVYKNPVMTGYGFGIRSQHDSMIESRSCSKALEQTKRPLQQVEFFNRKLQFVCNDVKGLIKGDCGNRQTMEWELKGNDFERFLGVQMLREDGTFKPLRANERTFAVGKTVFMRSPYRCLVNKSGYLCEACFGELSQQIPANTNLGHVSSTETCAEASQLVLSTKHFDNVNHVAGIEFDEESSKYLITGANDNIILLNPELQGKKVRLTMADTTITGLNDLRTLDDLLSTPITRSSSLDYVTVEVLDDKHSTPNLICVSVGSRESSFSTEMLAYLLERKQYTSDGKSLYVDMSEWDCSKPLMLLPLRHMNTSEILNNFEKHTRSTVSRKPRGNTRDTKVLNVNETRGVAGHDTPEEALRELYYVARDHLKVNIAHLAVIVMAHQARDPRNLDYTIPTGNEERTMVKYNEAIRHRSLGDAMAYQGQMAMFLSPSTYVVRDREEHPLDELILPTPELYL